MYVFPLGALVGYVTEEIAAMLAHVIDKIAQNLLFGYAHPTLALSDVNKELVEDLVVQRMID